MTPDEYEALARRVETEEPREELRAAVLAAIGSEAEPANAPDPLWSLDDANRMRPYRWQLHSLIRLVSEAACAVILARPEATPSVPITGIVRAYARGYAPTEARARTAAALRAMAVDSREMEP